MTHFSDEIKKQFEAHLEFWEQRQNQDKYRSFLLSPEGQNLYFVYIQDHEWVNRLSILEKRILDQLVYLAEFDSATEETEETN